MIYFGLFYMSLSMSHNSSYEFDGLTYVYLTRFLCFFLIHF